MPGDSMTSAPIHRTPGNPTLMTTMPLPPLPPEAP